MFFRYTHLHTKILARAEANVKQALKRHEEGKGGSKASHAQPGPSSKHSAKKKGSSSKKDRKEKKKNSDK